MDSRPEAEASHSSPQDGAPNAPPRSAPRWVGVTIKALLTLAFASLAFRMVDIGRLGAIVSKASAIELALAVTALTGLLVFNALRWSGVLARLGAHMPRANVFRLTFLGFFFNQVLPGGIGGDVYRFAAARQHEAGMWRVLGSLLADRGLSIIASALLLALAACLFPFAKADGRAAGLFGLAALFAFGLTFVLLRGAWALDILARLVRQVRISRLETFARAVEVRLSGLNEDCRAALRPPFLVPASPLFYALATQIGVTLVCWGLADAIGHPISLLAACATFPAIILLSMLPISLGGWGVRELASVVLLGPVGVPADEAVALSMLFGLANLGAGIAAAVVAVVHRALIAKAG